MCHVTCNLSSLHGLFCILIEMTYAELTWAWPVVCSTNRTVSSSLPQSYLLKMSRILSVKDCELGHGRGGR